MKRADEGAARSTGGSVVIPRQRALPGQLSSGDEFRSFSSDRVRYRPDSLTSPQRRRLKPFGIAPVEKSGPRLSKVMVWAQQDDRGSGAGELLDSVVVCIRDVDAPAPVGGNAGGQEELSIART